MPLDQVDVDKLEVAQNGQEKEMTFLEHLEELRWHLIRAISAVVVSAIVVYAAGVRVLDWTIYAPKSPDFPTYQVIQKVFPAFQAPNFDLVAIALGEEFIVHLKVSFILGIVLAFPIILWEIWKFIRPGLYEKSERRLGALY